MIKILIGGSPCTHWSIAKTKNRETKAEGIGWELFLNYVIAKEKFKPDLFLYENNKSAAQAIKDKIAEELGVGANPDARFTYINSALVSAQNRQRFYVTNFGDIQQPEDRRILLKDILETGEDLTGNDKSYCLREREDETMSRYIDADKLKEIAYRSAYEWTHGEHPMIIELDDIADIPTADVVEVIRCKDCKHLYTDPMQRFCKLTDNHCEEDDYCSNAERKE